MNQATTEVLNWTRQNTETVWMSKIWEK